ncbi:hypothetical protein PYCCODRAFT_1479355 [Trametes coccinea BRFM310]|uniref:Uncharacterized protein n=1 Tax=Trametes coccinea (strain BRFM310) TaxID=1353009 RepID=A0A1Y2IGG8_TRAC3|nr:hypothetical protein PYCCODRAFT_1479355 [Trametes coccinea BRFM310]
MPTTGHASAQVEPITIELDNGSVILKTEYDFVKQKHKVQCDICGLTIYLNNRGNPIFLISHRRSKNCDEFLQKRRRKQERDHILAIRQSIHSAGMDSAPQTPSPARPPCAPAEHGPPSSFTSYRDIPVWSPTPVATPRSSAPASSCNSPTPEHRNSLNPELHPTGSDLIQSSSPSSPSPVHTEIQQTLAQKEADDQLADVVISMGELSSVGVAAKNTDTCECRGVLVEWTPGSVWDTYPYHRHAEDVDHLPWEPIAIENNRWMRIRSEDCLGRVLRSAAICSVCLAVPQSERFTTIMKRAVTAAEHTPWIRLTHRQLMQLLRKTSGQYRRLRLKYRNTDRKLSSLRRRINDHQRIVMLLANHDVKRLRRLLSVALRKGAGASTLITQIQRSIAGLYTPRGGYEHSRELDVAFLAKALGGPRLLYALTHAYGLPSAATLNRHVTVPQLLPCLTAPTAQDVNDNLAALCDPHIKPPMLVQPCDPPILGHGSNPQTLPALILMVDGVAIEERCRYSAERNSIVGLCREHSHDVRTRVTGFDVIQDAEAALHGSGEGSTAVPPRCHYGKDATVVAIAPYARADHYTPVPILISSSCKAETGDDLAGWLRLVLENWRTHPYGERVHGPIGSLGSDGEASFRRAHFLLCMSEELSKVTPLGRVLHALPGFNHGLVGTCDPKHVIKRFATLLRNPKGIMISDTLLMCHDIYAHLQTLPGMNPEKAGLLLDPADKQNVPKAVHLLQTLLKLETDAPAPSLPSAAHRRHVLSFLSRVFGAFTLPFISVEMSLSEQVRSLVAYAHLIAILWVQHGTKFMTGALYADSQAIVKNVIINIARLQLVDGNLPFYIILEGTDRLEGLFADCPPSSRIIQGIMERNPDIDRGHRRLSLKNAMGVDHVNPRSWSGNVRVGDVELGAEWRKGREEAEKIFDTYLGITRPHRDFNSLFSLASKECDLLRPLGDYVGCTFDPDDLRTESPETELASKLAGLEDTHGGGDGVTHQSVPMDPSLCPASTPGEGTSALAPSQAPRTAPADDPPLPENTPHPSDLADDHYDDEAEGVELDDLLPDNARPGVRAIDDPSAFDDSRFLVIDGRKYLKASIVTIILTAKRSRKVTMRTLRVRGVTIEDLHGSEHWRFNSNELSGTDLVKAGDIAAILTRVGSIICLAVVEILEFQKGVTSSQRITAVELDDLEQHSSGIRALVQPMKMRRLDSPGSGDMDGKWLWDHEYIQFSADQGEEHTRGAKRAKHTLQVPGSLIYPLGPEVDHLTPLEGELGTVGERPHRPLKVTWSLRTAQLEEALDAAWEGLHPDTEDILTNLDLLPSLKPSSSLPYKGVNGPAFIVRDVPEHLRMKKLTRTSIVPCLLCGEKLPLSSMRDHVGHHILFSMRDVHDPKDPAVQVGTEPCGFCGREDTCITHLSKKNGTNKISSSCRYHYASMSYSAAAKSTVTTPCTNVPIHCPLCPRTSSGSAATIWKYNTVSHLISTHVEMDKRLPGLPPQFLVDSHISMAEEKAMGIGEEWTARWRDVHDVPGSDDVQEAQEELAANAVKRGRAESMAQVEQTRTKTARTQ